MTAAEFINALRIMRCIEAFELREAGVIDENWGLPEASSRDQVRAFMSDPFSEAMRMPDANVEKLFDLIQSKQPKRKAA